MKRIVPLLLAIVMVFSLIPMAAFAAGQTTISFETSFSEEMTVGDTFTVTANLADNVNFLTMTLSLKWNEDVVKFTGFNKTTRGALETEVYTYTAAIANHELGIVTGSDPYGYDTNGKIFTANFEIIGTGELGIGLKDADATEFEMVDNNFAAINPVIDYSAIKNLSVAAPESEGPAIPEGAPFTAITTDVGAVVDIDDRGTVSYSGYSTYDDVPHYHVYIPADANEVYVTHPAVEDPMVYNDYMTGNDVAGGYYADTADWSGGGFSFVYEAVTDGYNITIPTVGEIDTDWDNTPDQEVQFVADEYGNLHYAAAVERNDYTPICFFTFEYASEGGGEETTTYNINIAENIIGGTVSAMNADREPITKAAAGDEVHLNLQPDEGYMLQSFTVTDAQGGVGADNGVFVMPASDVTISATFTQRPPTTYAITVSESQNGTVTAAVDGVAATAAAAGKTVTLTPDPADGYMLDTLTVMNGETPVEVTNNTFTMPAAAVTVSAAFKAIPTGYTVTMGEDDEITAGETATIPVIVGYQSGAENAASTYNAFDMTFTYDATALTLTTASNEDMSITDNNGTVHIERYGSDKNVGEAAFNLTFTAKKTGTAEVKVKEAYVGISETAVREEAAKATILEDTAVVTVTVYNVSLPAEFEGDPSVAPGEDYTFTAKDPYYNYTITAKIDGSESELTVTGSGTEADPFKIAANQITGNLVITTDKEGKKFNVNITENADMAPAEGFTTGEDAAQYMTDYKAVLTPVDGYEYTVEIKIGTESYECAPEENVYTIPGSKITDNITISVTKTEKSDTPDPETEYDVTFQGSGKDDVAEGAAEKVKHGETYSFTLNKAEGYEYVVTATMGGTSVDVTETETTNDDGTVTYSYAIANVTGALVITIEKSDLKVEVDEYVNLDGKTIFLVSATQTLAEGKALAYDGTVMFFKDYTAEDATDAWSYLVIVEEPAAEEGTEESQQTATLSVEDAAKMISVVDAEPDTPLKQTYDVNEAGKVDINDAQLVYDMYNGVYGDFTKATMQKFLKADVNETRDIDVKDAAAIVTQIIANKQVAGN